MSESVIASMLALARDLPRAVRNQDKHVWERWPSRLLDRKTAAIYGVGSIAMGLAPRLKALGMRVIGVSSKKRRSRASSASMVATSWKKRRANAISW